MAGSACWASVVVAVVEAQAGAFVAAHGALSRLIELFQRLEGHQGLRGDPSERK